MKKKYFLCRYNLSVKYFEFLRVYFANSIRRINNINNTPQCFRAIVKGEVFDILKWSRICNTIIEQTSNDLQGVRVQQTDAQQ